MKQQVMTIEAKNKLAVFCRNPPGGWRITYVDETASTNSIAMEQGLNGAQAGTIIVAGTQTAGRGRLGKEWHSFVGCGLYLSIILRPKLEPAHLSRMTLAAGVALAETTEKFILQKPMLKWPNDLILQDRKCGGILAESDLRNNRSPLVILGIGVNVYSPEGGYDPDLRIQAGSINDFSPGCSRCDFLEQLVPAVQNTVVDLEENRFLDILRKWRSYDYTKGKELTWLTTGGEVITGICSGISDEGMLFITDSSGRSHQVLSGDIQLAKKIK
jgi:BirA family biotin operon repressor/biotin-[acetyl-CoA-carboxylase] ligase